MTKRAIEQYWKDKLDAHVGDLPVFVNHRDDTVDIEGSFAVCRVDEMQSIYNNDEVYQVDVQIWLFTSIYDKTSDEHDAYLRLISDSINVAQCELKEHYYTTRFPYQHPSGCVVYGFGPKRQDEEEFDDMWGDVIYIEGGFGAGPKTV